MQPTTVMGDPRWWGDYAVSVDMLLEQEGHAELIGRVSGQRGLKVPGYHLQFGSKMGWKLYSQEFGREDVVLAHGVENLEVGKWHRIGLSFHGSRIDVYLDQKALASVTADAHLTGQMGLGTGQWQNARFDNVEILPTAEWPVFVPHAEMTATATSEHAANHRGWDFKAANAIDDRPETAWSSEWEPRAPM